MIGPRGRRTEPDRPEWALAACPESTPEERSRVRRDECRANGHSFEHVLEHGRLAPIEVFCGHCDSRWRIHPDDAGHDFPPR